MEPQLWFTHVLNSVLGPATGAVLQWIGLHPELPKAPWDNTNAMMLLAALIVAAFGTWIGRRLSVDSPKGWQHIIELIWNFIQTQGEEVIGHGGGERFVAFLTTLTLFLLVGNLMGLVPSFMAPTSQESVTLGCAIVVFVLYHTVGIKRHHALYVKQFTGPMLLLAPLWIFIEVVSHVARMLSLSVRLYANMFAGDMLIGVFVALLPVAGLVFQGLHLFEALLQTYIFVVLTMAYLGGALADAH